MPKHNDKSAVPASDTDILSQLRAELAKLQEASSTSRATGKTALRATMRKKLAYSERSLARASENPFASKAELAYAASGCRAGCNGAVAKFLCNAGEGTYTTAKIAKATGYSLVDVARRCDPTVMSGVARRFAVRPRVPFLVAVSDDGLSVTVSAKPSQATATKAQKPARAAKGAKVARQAKAAPAPAPAPANEPDPRDGIEQGVL